MIAVARKLLLHDKLRFAITMSGVAFAGKRCKTNSS